MMRQTQALQAVHRRALEGFDRVYSALQAERKMCTEDRRFVSIAGAQWEGRLGEQFENRPKFEVNKIMAVLVRIYNEYRNNRIGVNFIPKDGAKDDKLAETAASLHRADEQDSCADEAYDNAFEEASSGGFGAYRLRACYENEEDDEDERQRIRIEPIFDADQTVYFDIDAKRQDKGDAKYCWVLTSMSHEAYKAAYKDNPLSWPKPEETMVFDWYTPEVVYVAEYYEIVEKREKVYLYKDQLGNEEKVTQAEAEEAAEDREEDAEEGEEPNDVLSELEAKGFRLDKVRTIKTKEVRKYILDGRKVLEDCGRIAGKHIPIVPVYGKRWFVDGVERCMGHVRMAKDAQRIKNMQLSKLGEIAAQSSVEKPILTPEQISGHQVYWEDDPIKNYPYMLLNPITGTDGSKVPSGPLGYTKPPQVPPALAALIQISEQDLQEILGSNPQQEKMVSNISGKAVELIQQRIDMQAYLYMSNMGKARRRGAEIWLSMAKEIYTERRRKMKAVDKYGEAGQIELMRPMMGDAGMTYENDLSRAQYDVTYEVGPSSSSKKAATVRGLTGLMALTQDPADQKVLTSMAIANMEGEGLDDLRKYYRKQMVSQGVIPPTEEERAALEAAQKGQQPDPQAMFLLATAEKEQALAQRERANTLKTLADADKSKAQTIEILGAVDAQEAARAQALQATAQPSMGAME